MTTEGGWTATIEPYTDSMVLKRPPANTDPCTWKPLVDSDGYHAGYMDGFAHGQDDARVGTLRHEKTAGFIANSGYWTGYVEGWDDERSQQRLSR